MNITDPKTQRAIEEHAAEWFIQRFLPSETTRNFCRAYNGLIESSRKIDKRTLEANARYCIKFHLYLEHPHLTRVIVCCLTPESEWAHGWVNITADTVDGGMPLCFFQSTAMPIALLDNATEIEDN